HDAEEQHGRYRADPEVMRGRHAVLGAVGRHAHDLDRAEVGGHEGQARHPRRKRTSGQEEIETRRYLLAGQVADTEYECEIESEQQVVDRVGIKPQVRFSEDMHGPPPVSTTVMHSFEDYYANHRRLHVLQNSSVVCSSDGSGVRVRSDIVDFPVFVLADVYTSRSLCATSSGSTSVMKAFMPDSEPAKYFSLSAERRTEKS